MRTPNFSMFQHEDATLTIGCVDCDEPLIVMDIDHEVDESVVEPQYAYLLRQHIRLKHEAKP